MALPPPAFLAALSTKLHRPSAAYLVPLLVSTTLSLGPLWGPSLYAHHTSHLPAAPLARSESPLPAMETIPRRRVYRECKEALVKASILVGVPKVIETLLELRGCVEEGARDDWFVREGLGREDAGWGGEEVQRRGEAGLSRVYRDDIGAIWESMGTDLLDVKWFSKNITYGTFLTPIPTLPDPSMSRDPLAFDPALLSVVTLSCLVPQRTKREILWHLRGALRNGMSREEVETLHQSIEEVCVACGVHNVGEGMPRVSDIEYQEGEGTSLP